MFVFVSFFLMIFNLVWRLISPCLGYDFPGHPKVYLAAVEAHYLELGYLEIPSI